MDDTICYSIIPNQLPPVAKLKVVDLVYCCSKSKTLINKVRQNYPVLSNSFELSENNVITIYRATEKLAKFLNCPASWRIDYLNV